MTVYTNDEGYSLSVATWLASDCYDHAPVKGPYLSATDLLKPMRMIVLTQRLKALKQQSGVAESIDISRMVPSSLGTAVHSAIEYTWRKNYKAALLSMNYPKKIVDRIRINPTKEELAAEPDIIPVYMEQRAYKKAGPYTIGGKFDFIGNGTLEDFKSMGAYGYMLGDKDEDQRLQGSIYRWLNPEIVTSDHMLIQQIITDWSALEAKIKSKKGYPQKRIEAKKLTLMTLKETDNWVNNRVNQIELLKNTEESKLPLCTSKELWQSKPVFKYYKNPESTTRSTANFDDYHQAHERYLKDKSVGIVREFPAKVKRCGYCACYDICTQKDEYLDAGILQLP